MQEDFLHFIWKHQYFKKAGLQTSDGEHINILKPGIHNFGSGPDFSEAKVKVGDLTWTGNVEIHRNASEWKLHSHHTDPAYNNVILHIVWNEDKAVFREDGTKIPTLQIQDRIDKELMDSYHDLLNFHEDILCKPWLKNVDKITLVGMLEKALISRLAKKAEIVRELVEKCQGDWEEASYHLLAMNFGFKVNTGPFLQLSKAVPLKLLMKNADNQFKMEALLFGQAGFLSGRSADNYMAELKNEYRFLMHKYALDENVLQSSVWKFGRLRPSNFPTLRIAQLSAVIHSMKNIFSAMISAGSIQVLRHMLSVTPRAYWNNHYRFGEITKNKSSKPGKSSVDVLIINTAVPLLAAYSKYTDDQQYMDKAVSHLQMIAPESNRIVAGWEGAGVTASSSADSQGMIELFNEYCLKKNCLSCNIGTSILNRSAFRDA